MSINELKERLRDVPGIETLTMSNLLGRQVFGFDGLIAAVDPNATPQEIEAAIRIASLKRQFARPGGSIDVTTPLPPVNLTEAKPMTAPSTGSFAAGIKAMMDEAKAGIAQARSDGLAKVGDAVAKLGEAKAAVTQISGSLAKTIEDEAASVMAELGQFSNFPPE